MIRRTLGAVTIGQSPREDVVPYLETILGGGFDWIQAGALDGLGGDEIEERSRGSSGPLLVTRLRGGTEVRVREGWITPRLRECVASLENRAELILFLCTGDLPGIESSRLILFPGPLLRNVVRGLAVARLGVLTPAAEQLESQRKRWAGLARTVVLAHASPYGAIDELESAASRLDRAGVDIVAMDCIGYTLPMRQLVGETVGVPVITAAGTLARVAAELLGS